MTSSAPDGWDWQPPGRVIAGPGCLARLGELAPERDILLVTSAGWAKRGVVERIAAALEDARIALYDKVTPNPDIDDLDAALPVLRQSPPALILALGGGSVIDTAKAMALALPAAGWSFAGHFRAGGALPEAGALPILAVPTTAGTGAEVTQFATVWDKAHRKKHSLQSPALIPRGVLLDAELTLGLPRATTLHAGLDALSHALEAVWNRNATSLSDGFALQALRLIFAHLPAVLEKPDSLPDRAAMLEASLLAGCAITQTRTALVHSMSYPLTAHLGVPHGLACGAFLAGVLAYNATADDCRIAAAAKALGHGDAAGLAVALASLLARIGLPQELAAHGVTRAAVEALAGEMITPARAGNNLRAAGPADVLDILRVALI
ncbi:MAG: phosphonoacetaldehyde reductase [Oceanibaculum nanhaiense]|uniref:phosphonoacetaldehyde reductase n=1 Tax=Oceanibaculum nanhaiense TaxID=1909734 RepID=UPI0025A3485E|nr:phosphonoacetaldehyde reductase [Oceanibaculum nanhaiense]MDM7947736.1 phosphonoacetaldehyde reductase [Oceanibaculum nanhaiense]